MEYTQKQTRQIRVGFYKKYHQIMNSENFKYYNQEQLDELLALGQKGNTVLQKISHSIDNLLIGIIVGGVIVYTVTLFI